MPQTLKGLNIQTLKGLNVQTIPSPQIFTHIVTLLNRCTGDEQGLVIETLSDRFTDVIREISNQKALHGLLGYEIFEVLDCNTPF